MEKCLISVVVNGISIVQLLSMGFLLFSCLISREQENGENIKINWSNNNTGVHLLYFILFLVH